MRTSLQAAIDASDVFSRLMASAITMKLVSWHQVSGIPCEIQAITKDHPSGDGTLQTENKQHSTPSRTQEPHYGPQGFTHWPSIGNHRITRGHCPTPEADSQSTHKERSQVL